MKLRFKQQGFQSDAVEAVVDCFAGQPLIRRRGAIASTRPTRQGRQPGLSSRASKTATCNCLTEVLLRTSRPSNAAEPPVSEALKHTPACDINLDIEMETGTGKTYCYIKSIFELNKRYGWSKFIVVVPSIAIREGVFNRSKSPPSTFWSIRQARPVLSSTTLSNSTTWRVFLPTPGST